MVIRSIFLTAFIIALLALSRPGMAENPNNLPKLPNYVQTKNLIVLQIDNTNDYLAYSVETGLWTPHTFPEGITASPVMSGNVAAFNLTGKNITELVTVDRNGVWRTFELPEPTNQPCYAIVSNRIAAYYIEGQAYAFSADLGAWDSIAVPTNSISVGSNVALVFPPNQMAAFSAVTGRWAVANTRRDN